MTDVELSREICAFISQSPTAYHAVASMTDLLDGAGFVRLREADHWEVLPGGCYYVLRNNSSIVAWKVGEQASVETLRFQMAAAHTDSPLFKIKQVGELQGPGQYLRLDTEGYGGMLDATWLDRPLGIAGRVMVRTDDGRIESRLVASDRDVALIPNVAIHQRRDANQGFAYDPYRFTFLRGGQLLADKYVALQAEWNGQGILFNLIPGIRWLHLRELFEAKVAYGYLSHQPEAVSNQTFYAELGVGIGNILRVCDLYSVWSLSPEFHWGMRFRIHLGL